MAQHQPPQAVRQPPGVIRPSLHRWGLIWVSRTPTDCGYESEVDSQNQKNYILSRQLNRNCVLDKWGAGLCKEHATVGEVDDGLRSQRAVFAN